MRLWRSSALSSSGSPWLASLTLVVLFGTIDLVSSVEPIHLDSDRSPFKGGRSVLKQDTVPQIAKKNPKRSPPLNTDVNTNNENIVKSNNMVVDPVNKPDNKSGMGDIQQTANREPINAHLLAQQQRERLAESARDNARQVELQNKLRIHEEERHRKEQQMQEREIQRQQRKHAQDDYLKGDVGSRREGQKNEKEKEQNWLNDVEKKSMAKYKQQQQEERQQHKQQLEQQSFNEYKVPDAGSNINNNVLSKNTPPKLLSVPNNINNNAINNNKQIVYSNNKDSLVNVQNNKAARDSVPVVNESPEMDGNRILPVVKYPRDDNVLNNNINSNNNVINGNNLNVNAGHANIGQQLVPGQHDVPETNHQQNPPEIRVDERHEMPAAGNSDFGQNANDNNFNANNNNNFNNFNNNNRDDFGQRNVDFQGSDTDINGDGQMGGLRINWDWDDFSIMFENYGRAEMKVRRAPKATTGEPWPLPQYYSKKDKKVYKISKDLRFIPTGVTCDVLEEAMPRHLQRVLRGNVEDMYDNLQNAEGTTINDPSLRYEKDEFVKAPFINRIELKVRKPCTKYPSLESDESYDLVIKKKKTFIYANEIWGLLRGLETLGHLVWRGTDGLLYIKETVISDYPRFAHRGLHIDTSRHFLFKEVLLDIIDSMEMNKLNVFHWHIVDDQSFPYESKVFPELSRKGAFHPTYVYSLEDIAELIEYARMRGVRVLPEFDTPGHTYAWGLGRPELLTQCFSDKTPVKGYLGPLDPSKNSTYRFLHSLFQEILTVFKDSHIHLGGDEVPLGCWQSNPEVMSFANELAHKSRQDQSRNNQQQMQQNMQQQAYYNGGGTWNQWSEEIKEVYEFYENRLVKMLSEIARKRKKNVHYIMWQEVINNNLQLPNDTIIQIWMGDMGDVMRATSMGYRVIYSTCWYLDHIEYGTKWPKYYQCDPVDQSYGYHIDEKKVMGGEAAFWSEYFSNENLIPLMWPRASAIAERLWSSKEVKNLDKAAERLSEHRCRMIKRGINAGEISGPSYCLHAPPKRRMYNDTAGCKGGNCSRSHNFVEIEDIQVHLSHRGGSLTDCGKLFHHGSSSAPFLLAIILVLVLALVAVTRSSSRLHRMRMCKNRFILLTFVVLLLVYFVCYTTIWMRAFEFSGSIHKTVQEDKPDKSNSVDTFNDQNFMPS